jgi:ligand-binding SRPBCC domain-containing protein
MHHLSTTTFFPLPIEQVFEFFSAAENLEKITPPSLKFSIVTPQPIVMKKGLLIDYRLKIQGFPAKWRTRIAKWDPPHAFIDEQLIGPYHTWIHLHAFKEVPDGTQMLDQVDYRLPLEPIGKIAHPIIRFQLKRIFTHRTKVIPKLLCPTMTEKVKSTPIQFQ